MYTRIFSYCLMVITSCLVIPVVPIYAASLPLDGRELGKLRRQACMTIRSEQNIFL